MSRNTKINVSSNRLGYHLVRYDREFNVDSKAEYTA